MPEERKLRLAELLTPPLGLTITGSPDSSYYPLTFTHRSLLLCERITGIDMLSANLIDPPARLIRALLYSALENAGAEFSLHMVGEIIGVCGLVKIIELLVKVWIQSMLDEYPEDDEPEETEEEKTKTPERKDTWMDVWAQARYNLHLKEDEWLDMTPRQARALKKQRKTQLQREEYMNGIVVAESINYSACHPKKPVSAERYMIHKFKKAKPEAVSGEDIMAQVARFREK